MTQPHPIATLLYPIVDKVAAKSHQVCQALWILETTGSRDSADLKAQLDSELRLLLGNREQYEWLLEAQRDETIQDPLLKRQINVFIRTCTPYVIPQDLLLAIAQKEAFLGYSYANFRPVLKGKPHSENDLRDILKKASDPIERQEAWEASKQIGKAMAPLILELVVLRNQAAQSLGYTDYFQMQLALQEVDPSWLIQLFEEVARESTPAYSALIEQIRRSQSERFQVKPEELGPWAWAEPFGQEDPIDQELDQLVEGVDMAQETVKFYERLGCDIRPILERSDMQERRGKNQHAFCIHLDRRGDIRTLNNVKNSLKWLETLFHEFGHAIYEMGMDDQLPWLLREPPHMITTEAMALLAGRAAYRPETLKALASSQGTMSAQAPLIGQALASLERRQLLFSRWVLVMTHFEIELYRNPEQDLNELWWSSVEKYQQIQRPQGREKQFDWASKIHVALCPVYYFSYLLGELLASSIEKALKKEVGSGDLQTPDQGAWLKKRLFQPGNSYKWSELVQSCIQSPLTAEAWLEQFAKR